MAIRKRRDRDTWTVDYRDASGVRRRITARSRDEAKQLDAEMDREAREGPRVRPDNPVLAQYAQQWLETAASRLKAKTVKSYRQLLTIYILPELGALKLRDIERRHVKQLLGAKLAAGFSKNTVRLIRAALSVIFAEALDDAIVKTNPATAIGRHRGASADGISQTERQAVIRPFSDAEIAAFLDAAKTISSDFHALFLTAFRTGMRPGEVRALRWSDVDFTRREILVERAFSDTTLSSTKTGETRRVDMSNELVATLAHLHTLREKQALARGWGEVPELIFVNNAGHAHHHTKLRAQFDRTMRRAGLSGHVPYDTRHTFITTLLSRGVPINYIAAQAGHRDPTTTLKFYTHWLPRQDKSYVDALDPGASELPEARSAASMAPSLAPNWSMEVVEVEKPLDLVEVDGPNRTGESLIHFQQRTEIFGSVDAFIDHRVLPLFFFFGPVGRGLGLKHDLFNSAAELIIAFLVVLTDRRGQILSDVLALIG